MKKDYTIEIDLLGVENLREVELFIKEMIESKLNILIEFGEEKERISEEIKVYIDNESEMLKIYRQDKCLFWGNFWDFGRPDGIIQLIKDLGFEAKIIDWEGEEVQNVPKLKARLNDILNE